MRKQEMQAFSWTEADWDREQKRTAGSGWTVIHPNFWGKGGWSLMMDAYDASLRDWSSPYDYVCRQVRKANNYAQKVRQRYERDICFEADIIGYGEQTYFRVVIPKGTR